MLFFWSSKAHISNLYSEKDDQMGAPYALNEGFGILCWPGVCKHSVDVLCVCCGGGVEVLGAFLC